MSNMTLDKIMDVVQTLTPDEQRQLRAQIDQRLAQHDQMKGFHQSLLASGLVTRIKPPRAGAGGPRRLIEVQGKPLSESIMEERR